MYISFFLFSSSSYISNTIPLPSPLRCSKTKAAKSPNSF